MKGFTLLEAVVAMAVLAMMVLAISTLFDTSSESLEYFTNVGSAEIALRRTLDMIAGDVHQAQASAIAISSLYDDDSVTIRRSFGESGTATMGYLVNGDRQLVRVETLPGPVTNAAVVAENVDSRDAQGAKGFRVERVGSTNLFSISLRVNIRLDGGETMTRTFATTVGTRS